MTQSSDDWPAVGEPPDPLPACASEALRESRVCLWRDLWAKVERYELEREKLADIMDRLAEILAEGPRDHRTRRLEQRLARLRSGDVIRVGRPRKGR